MDFCEKKGTDGLNADH